MRAVSSIVTIKDVAQEAGVTHTTVSRVIRNLPFVKEETRIRVLRALKRLNYRPNMVARGLVNKRSHVIGLITPELNPYVLPVVRGVTETSVKWDYALMLIPMDTWLEEDRSISFVAQNWQVDGLLVYNVVYHEKVPEKVHALQSANIPLVFINKFLDKKKLNAVGVDNYQGVHLMMEHLAQLGHRRIAMLCGDLESVDGMERSIAWRQSMQKLGLKIDESLIGIGDFVDDTAYRETHRILNTKKPPTAIYCANDLMAVGAIRAVQDLGLRVPDDVAVAGFDDLETARYVDIPVTTVRPPREQAAAKAFDMMMAILRDPKRPPEQVRLPCELVVRASTVRSTTKK